MKKFLFAVAIALGLSLPVALPAAADGTAIILMHGKDSTQRPRSPVGRLAEILEGDLKVAIPEMPWVRGNEMNGTLKDAFATLDGLVARLRAGGATKIVVGGHSMGAAGALAYPAARPGIAGVLMMAPGHRPDVYAPKNGDALEQARSLVANGKPDTLVNVFDINTGKRGYRDVRVDSALSFFDPDGPMVMQNSAPKLPSGVPVLLIIGQDDAQHPRMKELVFEKLPSNPKSAYVVVEGGHRATPMKGRNEIREWLSGL
jgi:pimeloyl-ACP methyl ester carboxylesterase